MAEVQLVIQTTRLMKRQRSFSDDQHMSKFAFEFCGAGTKSIQPFCPTTLTEFEIACMVDNTCCIGIGVAGTDMKMVENHSGVCQVGSLLSVVQVTCARNR